MQFLTTTIQPMANLRYRRARDTADRLGQVFTPQPIAALLAESILVDASEALRVLDLGAGKGALAKAVLERNASATATLVEIDKTNVPALEAVFPSRTTVIQSDVLKRTWQSPIHADLIVSNPPYSTIPSTPELEEILAVSGLSFPVGGGEWIRGDVAFLARAWELAERGTHIGLIVAAPMIRDSAYRILRRRLVGELRGLCVTQLDEGTFQNAQVRAFMIAGQRTAHRRRNVLLRKAKADGTIIDEIEISYSAATTSLDIDYHQALKRINVRADTISDTLASIGASITRGSRSQREFERLGLRAFHTTDFPGAIEEVFLKGSAHNTFHSARQGDILIPRVGTRCLVRQARVSGGAGLFTDCIYRLSVDQRNHARVWKTLSSSFGAEWRIMNASGSCAKHLPIQTLWNMPLLS
ncbi:methyltransferase [Zoogloeaceae bacterium G21618-S1]|nr:methyltransferase [Zoogloeaceae bacterium G21618-S1]